MVDWYVVGGSVRDLLLGKPCKDIDFSFAGTPDEFVNELPKAIKTKSNLGIWVEDGCEFTRIAGNLAEDSTHRDLTINTACVGSEGRFFAHPRFIQDMQKKILRLTSAKVLEEDPLRLYRVARFAAFFPDWHVDEATLEIMGRFSAKNQKALAGIPKERVGRELFKALESPKPSRFFSVLKQAKSLLPWFNELETAAEIPAGPLPWHDNSTLEHTLEVMDRCAGHPMAVWMGLCHDLGKIYTDTNILPHHYGHEEKGAKLAKEFGTRFGLPNTYIRAGEIGTVLHMKAGMYGSLRCGTRRDLLDRLHRERISHDFWVLVRADSGIDWTPKAEKELKAMLAVHLSREWQDRGEESGKRLRMLQCAAISMLPKTDEDTLPNKIG